MQIASLLTGELQLGQQLNNSVVADDSANFSLLLAMLSKDVCDQSQFHLENNLDNRADISDADSNEVELRKHFELARAQHLVANELDGEQSIALGQLAQEQGILAARLSHCLNPEALSFNLDKTHDIDSQVFDNLDSVSAARYTDSLLKPQYPQGDIDLSQLLMQQQTYHAQLIA